MSLEGAIIDYKKNEKNILHWKKIKGEYRYETIIKFLNEKQIECNWENITNYMKYDKRLLINSFKYIVFLEELYKSFIKENEEIPVNKLLKLTFSESINRFLSINKEYDDINLIVLRKEKNVIIKYRNSVVHNKILLNSKFNKKSLDEVLGILVFIMPASYRGGYIKDINDCSKNLIEKLWHINLNTKSLIKKQKKEANIKCTTS